MHTSTESIFHRIASTIPNTTESRMFGALCIKADNGKAGVMFYNNLLVFKLDKEDSAKLLKLDGVKTFEPMAGRPMNGWLEVPAIYQDQWESLAHAAMDFVKLIEIKKEKPKKKK